MANLAVHINDFNMATSNEETTEVELIITELPHSSEVASQSQKSNFSVEGNTFDKEMFLQALREYKCLWDTSDPNYKNRNMKVNAWNALSSLFNQEVAFLQKIYKNLKDSLKKCLDKRRAMTRSGAPAGCLPTCKYFEVMRFLHEKTSNLPTHSNVDISPAASSHVIETGNFEDQSDAFSPAVSTSSTSPFQPIACSMSPLSVPASPCTLTTPTPERPIDENTSKKRKRPSSEKSAYDPFLQQIKQMDDQLIKIVNKESADDEATAFCMSLVPVLKDFDKKKLRLAKIKIQQLLFDIEFDGQ